MVRQIPPATTLRRPPGSQMRPRAGMTLVELTISMFVLFVAVGATIGSIASSAGLEEGNRQTVAAFMAARGTLETMQGRDFIEVFALYNQDPADDPDGPGTGPGSTFSVAGFDVQAGDADGFVGEVFFPVDPVTGDLRETTVEPTFGMPRDLNADGATDGDDRSGDYRVLPVRVRVVWRNVSGNRSIEMQTLLASR